MSLQRRAAPRRARRCPSPPSTNATTSTDAGAPRRSRPASHPAKGALAGSRARCRAGKRASKKTRALHHWPSGSVARPRWPASSSSGQLSSERARWAATSPSSLRRQESGISIDFDRYEVNNSVRHVLGIEWSGFDKSGAFAQGCRRINPFCIPEPLDISLGAVKWEGTSTLAQLEA